MKVNVSQIGSSDWDAGLKEEKSVLQLYTTLNKFSTQWKNLQSTLLKCHYTCGLQKFSGQQCSLLKGTSKTLLLFLTDKHTSGQWHKIETTPISSPGIPAFCFNDPHCSGNKHRIIRTEQQVSGWRSNSSRMMGIKGSILNPQGKRTAQSQSLNGQMILQVGSVLWALFQTLLF